MAQIEIRLARGYWARKVILLVLFLVFGMYAAYDGLYKYPADNGRAARWDRMKALAEKQQGISGLTTAELDEFKVLQTEFDGVVKQPLPHEQKDVTVQYLFMGLAGLGTVAFAGTWWLSARRKYRYHDDGTLVTPEGTFPPDRMTGIDLTKWQRKSIALLEIDGGPDRGGSAVKLDAWIYDGLESVIETLDRRFHPEDYEEKRAAPPRAAHDAAPDQPELVVDSDAADDDGVEKSATSDKPAASPSADTGE